MLQVIKTINKMIVNSHLISSVVINGPIYFIYNAKYIFSMIAHDTEMGEHFFFTVYPTFSVEQFNEVITPYGLSEVPSVTYKSEDFKSTEAVESFSELYSVLKSKLYNVDSVFNDIIGEDEEISDTSI